MASTILTAKLDATVEYIAELLGWPPADVIQAAEGYPVRNKGADGNWRCLREEDV